MNLNRLIPTDFSGFIHVSSQQQSLLLESYGYRDYPNQLKNNIHTRFGIASGGKTFVAVAIMKLIEEQKLKLHQPISKILSIKLPNVAADITVMQLLNHTSGVGDYFDEEILDDYASLWKHFPNYAIRKNIDLLPLFIDKKMIYPPGEKFQYNNTGYVLLAQIIEEVTQKSFDSYLQETIFTPANMLSTGYFALDRLPANTANAYIYDKDTDDYYSNIYSIDVKGTGAGGCFTTLHDLANFWQAMNDELLLSKKTVMTMQKAQASDCYGLGFWLAKQDEEIFPYMQGHDPGISFVSSYNHALDTSITIMSNFEQSIGSLHKTLSKALFENNKKGHSK